uniref:Uncharacterized protein n=1 Tax=Romanomermis culicivorax TaxID=13658 RepID=A0A915IJR3_ROMCU
MFSMDDVTASGNKTAGMIIYDDNQDQRKTVPSIVFNDELHRPRGSASGDQEKMEQIQEINHHLDHPASSSRDVSGSTYAVDVGRELAEHQQSTPTAGLTPKGLKWIGQKLMFFKYSIIQLDQKYTNSSICK